MVMPRIRYNGPPTDGIDFSDPIRAREYQDAQNRSIQHVIDKLLDEVGNAIKNITFEGERLEVILRGARPHNKDLKAFAGTMGDARRQRLDGWYVCDGTYGTPNLANKFLRGVTATRNAGATGGASTHAHGVGTYVMPRHRHTISKTGYCVAEGAGSNINDAAYTGYCGGTCAIEGTSAAGSSLPPYYDVIWLMYRDRGV